MLAYSDREREREQVLDSSLCCRFFEWEPYLKKDLSEYLEPELNQLAY